MTKELWKLFNEADVIVAHNGDAYDIKMSNRFFIAYGLKPPAPYKTVDTLKLARRYFKFESNKLDYLGQLLFNKRKVGTSYSLWEDCMKKDKEALMKMEKYCEQDVKLLVELYNKLKPWHTGHPNHNVYNGTIHHCPVCNSTRVQRRGMAVARAYTYQRYHCQECGSWSKGKRIIKEDKK